MGLPDALDAALMVHVEVEGPLAGAQALAVFSWRMLEYHVLFCWRERRRSKIDLPPQVYSLGVLIDQSPRAGSATDAGSMAGTELMTGHAPQQGTLTYANDFLDQQTRFTFPIVELESWRPRWAELESLAPTNPFAVIIMAQLLTSGHPDKSTRLGPLLDLHRRLYRYGYTRDQIGQLLRLVEWIIRLPPALESEYLESAQRVEQEHQMSYVTIAERVYTQRGVTQGEANTLLRQIQRRFGLIDETTTQRIRSADAVHLETWTLNFVDADTLDDVFRD